MKFLFGYLVYEILYLEFDMPLVTQCKRKIHWWIRLEDWKIQYSFCQIFGLDKVQFRFKFSLRFLFWFISRFGSYLFWFRFQFGKLVFVCFGFWQFGSLFLTICLGTVWFSLVWFGSWCCNFCIWKEDMFGLLEDFWIWLRYYKNSFSTTWLVLSIW